MPFLHAVANSDRFAMQLDILQNSPYVQNGTIVFKDIKDESFPAKIFIYHPSKDNLSTAESKVVDFIIDYFHTLSDPASK